MTNPSNSKPPLNYELMLDQTSMDIVLILTHAQGPARMVQMVGLACAAMADEPETDNRLRPCMAEIAENLERYAATILEHMVTVQT